jgi:hypothetical protein
MKYIDKDKIIPWLEHELEICDMDEEYAYQYVKDMIEIGLFDWQQGSE